MAIVMQEEYYTLEEAARIVRPERDGQLLQIQEAVKELLDAIFTDTDLIASCFINTSMMIFYVDEQINPDNLEKENPIWPWNEWQTKQVIPDNLPETVLVDVLLDDSHQSYDCAPGKIQLSHSRKMVGGRWFAPLIYMETEQYGHVRCYLNKPKEVAESELMIRSDNLENYIRHDDAALKRLEAHRRSTAVIKQYRERTQHMEEEFRHAQCIYLPVIDDVEVIPVRLIPLITEPEITPIQLVELLWNPKGVFSKTLNHSPFRNDWTLIYKEMEAVGNSDTRKQLEQLPNNIYVTMTDFKQHEVVVSRMVGLRLDREVPPPLLNLVSEGWNLWSIEANPADSISEAARLLKKKQTKETDVMIENICKTISAKAEEHMRNDCKERVVHHARFVTEAGLRETSKERTRALNLVKNYINSEEAGLRFHGFKPANKPINLTKPYFVSENDGIK